MSDKAKYSYLAGIIDGEGCLTIGAGNKGNIINYNSIVMVTSTSEALVKWLQHNFGGNYYKSGREVPRCKPAFIWRFLRKADIERLLLAILPYLIIKRDQAILLLEFVRLPRFSQSSESRQVLYNRMRLLNKRGMDSVTTNTQDTLPDLPHCGITQHSVSFNETLRDGRLKIESELTGDRESDLGVIQGS